MTITADFPRRRLARAALGLIGALALGPGLAACAGGTGPAVAGGGLDGTIEGTVTYRERIALSPDALLEVALFDMSRPDAGSRPVAKSLYDDLGQVPIRFDFDYEPGVIDPEHDYVLVARILEGDQPVFLTLQHEPVLTKGAGDTVDLMLARLPGT